MMEKGSSHLKIINTICFLYISDLTDLLPYKEMIENNMKDGSTTTLAVIDQGKATEENLDKDLQSKVYQWLNSSSYLSIAVAGGQCSQGFLTLMMASDLRLGGANLSIKFPSKESASPFDFQERCRLLMGRKGKENPSSYSPLLNQTLGAQELYQRGFINRIIDMEKTHEELQLFVNGLLEGRNGEQIQGILNSFKHYKQLGLKVNRQLLLEQEAKEFCRLIIKEYEKSRSSYEN